ncbi:hydrolase [Erythrobacter sp. HL-111]|uniref:hydrolase n=1 Tax=Erythrobacter sp. HL-111 TaxID=1798193 RepID=UPI0006D94F9A|nr:hydrolase [Erythrobacter sp. HL-111]KPP91488.1 MAG: glutamate carboxypeptidase [Erythrobacteraceae bacterium HL-111]SDS25004.1 glutamate carboxypeptidase [Erythrobacter sp. HL-111]
MDRRSSPAIDATAMLEQVEAWSAINTGSGHLEGLARQADALAEAFAALPGTVELVDPAPVTAIAGDGSPYEKANGRHLVVRVRPRANRRILLTGHMDTVFPPDHPFQHRRWLDEETLNGPGVADMKGGIAVMLHALTAFEQSPAAPGLGYDVMINSDEETGSLASAPLIEELARGKLAALTYEPAALPDGTLAHERGGTGNYAVAITGRSAHAGRNPQDGRNAIVAAADLILRLKAMEGEDITVNPARLEGGGPNNVVPDHALVRFNIRPKSSRAMEGFDTALDSVLEEIAAAHEVAVVRHGGVTRPPKPVDARAQALFDLVRECGAELGQDIRWQSTGGVCDGNNIAACGVPVVDTMGVRGGAIHSPDEFLIVPSLAERAVLSARVIERLAEGALGEREAGEGAGA